MRISADMYLSQVKRSNRVRDGFCKTQRLLSLMVVLVVFWGLKLTGITMAGEAFCGKEEHVHSEVCTVQELICELEETEGHVHTTDCLQKNLVCEIPEQAGHVHTEACIGRVLNCTLKESEGHTHGEGCSQKTLVCTLPEETVHTHTTTCYNKEYTCGQEGMADHQHDESCVTVRMVCNLAENAGHRHNAACFVETMTCEQKESSGHVHGETCYSAETGYICGKKEAQAHFHTDACYVFDEAHYICGLEEAESHVHGESCYNKLKECTLEEHTHNPNCYSDLSADLESSTDWEKTFAGLICSPRNRENVVLVAKSQLDVKESVLNFHVDEFGIRHGITRYGQWYGNAYGDWSAMFVSFCLEYAGVQDVPRNAGVESMRLEWDAAKLYTSAGEHIPVPGELVFLDKNLDGTADAVAIVTDLQENILFVIEGDLKEPVTQIGTVKLHPEEDISAETANISMKEAMAAADMAAGLLSHEDAVSAEDEATDMVAETLYALADPTILGFGLVPERAPVIMMMSPRASEMTYLATTINYSSNMFTSGRSFVIYAQHNGEYYAFVSNPANGIEATTAAVPIQIDQNGNIYTDVENPERLLWNFTSNNNNGYVIENVATKRYLHPGTDPGVIFASNWPTALRSSGTGATFVHTSNNVGIAFNSNEPCFEIVRNRDNATTLYFGVVEQCTVWLDGTQGGISAAGGSQNQNYSVTKNAEFQLPTVWLSPNKYNYVLRGWYDVTNGMYYEPGASVTIKDNTVFYADWMAATYDIGQYNAYVADTVSTNSFITTQLFDYNYLFNVLSADPTVNVSADSHSETWYISQGGTIQYENRKSLDFIFLDYGNGGTLDYPNNRRDGVNQYPGAGIVTGGIYNSAIGEALFTTDDHVPGKVYLGTGDHLFQIDDDSSSPYYGYYYYDSTKNAASYNKSAGRFYVYDYLEATSAELTSAKSDFLPLNSPYANTNGQQLGTYIPDSYHSQYTNYVYDAKQGDSADRVNTNYAFGMKMDVSFYLPNKPGEGGNKDLYGNDLRFLFSGDDDLWVLVDGKLALDIGGIHQVEKGEINFSTGEVLVQGNRSDALSNVISSLEPGEHTLTVMYLERGASHSNCSIYFNLAPRYGLEIKKEDVLTQQLLNGTEFTVYEDLQCTKHAALWESEQAYQEGQPARSTFTVKDGVAKIWGFGSGNTYYIKETGPPKVEGYGIANGIIQLSIKKDGQATYNVEVIPEKDEDGNEYGPSNGFTVHGVSIDEATKTVYLTATNAPQTVTETTTVQVIKKWEDTKDHSGDYIEAYLTITDPDGTVRRIREVTLSTENDWQYIWTNLPKYDYGQLTEVQYGIEESYESGYYSTVRQITSMELTTSRWAEAVSFVNGEEYILKTANGYLSTTTQTDAKLKYVDEATAQSSSLAKWTVVANSNQVRLTNGAKQILSFNNSNNNRYFYATTGSASNQAFNTTKAGNGYRFNVTVNNSWWGSTTYYMSANQPNTSGQIATTTTENDGLILMPMELITETESFKVDNWGYLITNTPLPPDNETSLSVQKDWVLPDGFDATLYQEELVTVRLLANGVNSGRTVTLSLKNGWSGIFQGLPYKDTDGNVISYTVEEVWEKDWWSTTYGKIEKSGASTPTYSTTITNAYHQGGPLLPSTGTAARILYMLCGGSMMLSSLVYGMILRRKRERRTK